MEKPGLASLALNFTNRKVLQMFSDFPPCPECGGLSVETILTNSTHYSRLDCPECKRFIRWNKHPNTILKEQQLQAKLDAICTNPQRLNEWEGQFIASALQQLDLRKKLSPKQLEIVDRIYQQKVEVSA